MSKGNPVSPVSPDISLKGLDDFSRKFLIGDTRPAGSDGDEVLHVPEITRTAGGKIKDEALEQFYKQRKVDFIRRAGAFTEDLVGFIVEQRKSRNLSDEETIFALALANINFREAYGSPQGKEQQLTAGARQALLDKFDEICWGAQQYYDANAPKPALDTAGPGGRPVKKS